MSDSPTFEAKVNEAVSNMTQAEDGKWVLPEGLDEPTAYAVNLERRRRDTQTAFSKADERAKVLAAENAALTSGWEQVITKSLTAEQNTELTDLKATDPDAWREKMNEYEAANKTAFTETRKAISAKAAEETELQFRERLLEEHNTANPDHAITEDVIDNDLPPRFVKRLESGEVTFEQFLNEVHGYISKGKVIYQGDKPPGGPNLGKEGGTSRPQDTAVDQDARQSYKTEVY